VAHPVSYVLHPRAIVPWCSVICGAAAEALLTHPPASQKVTALAEGHRRLNPPSSLNARTAVHG
jgi:hypothetical protein